MFKKDKEKLEGLTCHARRQERIDPANVQECAILAGSAHTLLPLSFGKQPRRRSTPTGNGEPPCVTAIDSTPLRGGAI